MNIDELTIKQVREIADMLNVNIKNDQNDPGPWIIGEKYFIRTVTMHLTGELVSVSPQELVLKDAAWIADSGRFHEFLKDPSNADEVEPFVNHVGIGRGSIIDFTVIPNIIKDVK